MVFLQTQQLSSTSLLRGDTMRNSILPRSQNNSRCRAMQSNAIHLSFENRTHNNKIYVCMYLGS